MKENKNHYLTDAINSFNYISLSNAFSGVAATTDDTIIQYPAVRYPHTQWFRLADVEAYFVFLLNNGAIIRAVNKNKEITVARKYTTILIESRYVPIPLITEGGGMPLLAPQKVNSIPYFFKEIRANDCTINSFNAMLANLKTKMPKVGNFYIEKLVLKGQEYHNVIIEGGPTWKHSKGLNPSSPHMKQFNEMKKEIRKTSTLPESMKQEEPKPVIELIPPTQPGARAIIKGNTSRK